MVRDFEHEFIEFKQNEIPDLWNRIEAGLSEKKVTASVPEKENTSFKKINWRRWGTLAAACLCAAIIIPAISMINRKNDGPSYSGGQSEGNMSNSTAMDYTTADCEASEAPEMNAGDNGGAAASDAGSVYSEDKGSTDAASDCDNSDTGTQDGMEMTQTGGTSAAPSEAENASETVEAEEEARVEDYEAIKGLDLQNGQKIEGVLVQIVDTDFTGLSGEEIIYQAIVLEPDADAIFTKNMQIEIVYVFDMESDSLSMAKNKMMKESESYEVSLCFEQDKFLLTNVSKAD